MSNTILIVDDEREVLSLLEELLTDEGYNTFISTNAKESLNIFNREKIDLVLTDIMMVGMSGIELLKILKKQNEEIEVIIITGYATLDSAINSIKFGAYDYIIKPFSNLERVTTTVAKAIEKRRLKEENRKLLERLDKWNQELETQVLARTSELHKAYKELRIAQLHLLRTEKLATVGELAAGVAHEIGNPLSSIYSLIEVLQEEKLTPFTKESLKEMSHLVERISKIVRDLVDFSRTPQGPAELININSVIESMLKLAHYNKKFKGIKIIKQLSSEIPILTGSAGQLEQLFLNLLLNAADAIIAANKIKKIKRNGKIIISTKSIRISEKELILLHRVQRQGINNIYSDSSSSSSIDLSEDFISEIGDEALEINFEENGIGIEKENLTKIFDTFFNTSPEMKANG